MVKSTLNRIEHIFVEGLQIRMWMWPTCLGTAPRSVHSNLPESSFETWVRVEKHATALQGGLTNLKIINYDKTKSRLACVRAGEVLERENRFT